ncbi:hypothetical protein C8R46DRAFT_1110063 [Mycena filopes]|nr:hypothetical protein C8R46DRAFT_1110063 [Mycena filopes]
MNPNSTDLRARLAAVDARILQQRQVLSELEAERRAVCSELQSITYPVLTLPPEITAQILVHCLPDDCVHPSIQRAPLIFLRVCRTWTNIASSTPDLWTTLHVDVDEHRHAIPTADTLEAILNTWFERAGACPLTLVVRGHMMTVFLYQERTVVHDILRRYAHQLHRLDLLLAEDDFTTLDGVTWSFPLLRALTVGIPFTTHAPDGGKPIIGDNTFTSAPCLDRLTLKRHVAAPFLGVSFMHLTVFEAGVLKLDDCLEVLRLAPLLLRCTFGVDETSADYPGAAVLHTRLQYFYLTGLPDREGEEDESSSGTILQHITFPSLHTLRLAEVTDLNVDQFESFISRSSAPLRTFSLAEYFPGSFTLYHLACMRSVTEVELDAAEGSVDEFLESLAREDFLPRLQNLTFTDRAYPPSLYKRMIHSVCSRWKAPSEGVALLQSLKILWRPLSDVGAYWDDATVGALRQLEGTGTVIHLGPPDRNLLSSYSMFWGSRD